MLLRSEGGGVPRYSARQTASVYCIGKKGTLNHISSKVRFTDAVNLLAPGLLAVSSILF